MRQLSMTLCLGLLISAASARAADQRPPAAAPPAIAADEFTLPPDVIPSAHGLLLSGRIGPAFPQAFNKLDTTFLAEAELAYQLPWRDRALGIFFEFGYTQPTVSGTQSDPRLDVSGSSDAYTLTIRDFAFSLGVQYLLPLPAKFVGYAGVGVGLHLTRSSLKQTAGGVDAGYTYENSTRAGLVVRLGAAYPLGPGLISLELRQEYTGINHALTGLDNTAFLTPQLGYTLAL